MGPLPVPAAKLRLVSCGPLQPYAGVPAVPEVMRQHLFVQPDPWRLTGLIDFEPAMRGLREYEFAAVGVFFSGGDAGLLRRLLTAYGHDLDDGLAISENAPWSPLADS